MSQINLLKTSGFQIPPSGRLGYGFDVLNNAVIINADGTTTILAKGDTNILNVIANKGVDIEANLPTEFVQGDVYVTTDTFKIYTANDIVSWSSVDLVTSQFVTDIVPPIPVLYQFTGSTLDILAGGAETAKNWLDFIPQDPPPAHVEGRFFYDDVVKTFVALNDINGIALNVGGELRSRLDNQNAFELLNGKVGYVRGAIGTVLDCDLLDSSILDQSIRGLGLFTHDIVTGAFGYIARYGAVRDVDTSMWTAGDVLYAKPHFPGDLTNVRPSSPHYPVRIGLVVVSHATTGVIGVDTLAFNGSDTSANIEGSLNGMITFTPDIQVSVSGGIIYADVTRENEPTLNLPFLLGGTRYVLNTTTNTGLNGAARVIVPPGPDTENTQESFLYIYLDGSIPTLGIATSEPSIPYAPVGYLVVFDNVRTLADGKPFGYRRSNNAIDLLDGIHDGSLGIFADLLAAFREKLGSNWLTGQDGTPTVNDTTIRVALSSGVGRQFRKSNLPLFDGLEYLIYNTSANLVTYADSVNLIDIVEDANGGTLLANGRYYTIRLFYQLNSNGVGNNVIATRPLGSYTSSEEAQSDPLNYAVAINDTKIEEIVYPLYDILLGRTGAGGTTISLIELRNRKSKLAQGGGGGGATGTGANDKIRVSAADTINDYFTSKFEVLGGLIKSILNPGANEQIQVELPETIAGNRRFEGQAHGGNTLHLFSASKTFDFDDGNIQEMPVSGDTTIEISNMLIGTAILRLPITVGTNPIITIGTSLGDIMSNSADLVDADGDKNTITIIKYPSEDIEYVINNRIV